MRQRRRPNFLLHLWLSLKPIIMSEDGVWKNVWNPKLYFQMTISKSHSESRQTSNLKTFAKIANGFQPPTVCLKSPILHVWLRFEFISEFCYEQEPGRI